MDHELEDSEYACYEAFIKRLSKDHQRLRGEQRFAISIGDEAVAALIGLALLPLESAIIDLGRIAANKPPLHAVCA